MVRRGQHVVAGKLLPKGNANAGDVLLQSASLIYGQHVEAYAAGNVGAGFNGSAKH
ncbi:hypothetical protein ACLOJK_004163 [Asimina triloba]